MKPTAQTSHPAPTPIAIKVLGIGGAGSHAVCHLAREHLDGVEFAILNTDANALAQSALPKRLLLGSKTSRGLGAGGDPDRGRQAAEEDLLSLRSLCQGAHMVFVIAGLGGGTGTGAAPVVARIAKETGALVLSIVLLPFACEGARRHRQALLGLQALQQASDGVICIENQKVFKLIDENTGLVEAFQITNELVAQGVRGIWRLLSRPGLINVDFANLCAVTQGKHAASILIHVEARGPNRVQELLEKILNHPLSDRGQALAGASHLLAAIAGGPDLAMKDVEAIMENIRRQADQAQLNLGTAVDPNWTDRLALTLVGSVQPARSDLTASSAASHSPELTEPLLDPEPASQASARFVPPAPELPPEKTQELYFERSNTPKRKTANRLRQGQLPLEIVSKGRFEKSQPTLHHGEDLDVPTYIRRGVPLN